jgi:hypothetical protein
MYEPQLIAPFESGLIEYFKPYLIAQDAFERIEDAYTWRGLVKKREGYKLLASLPVGPVQGFSTRLIPGILDEQLLSYNKTNAYLFNTGTKVFDDVSFFQTTGAPITWTGGDDDFFWSTNYAASVWVTNNVDPIRFYNGSTTQGWNNQRFIYRNGGTARRVLTAKMIIPYKGRLVLLNTTEENPTTGSSTNYYQRARYYRQRGLL